VLYAWVGLVLSTHPPYSTQSFRPTRARTQVVKQLLQHAGAREQLSRRTDADSSPLFIAVHTGFTNVVEVRPAPAVVMALRLCDAHLSPTTRASLLEPRVCAAACTHMAHTHAKRVNKSNKMRSHSTARAPCVPAVASALTPWLCLGVCFSY
jgi:hypothetical protein